MYLQLVSKNNNQIIYRYDLQTGNAEMLNDLWRKDMLENGVRIPRALQESYGGRDVVKLNDPNFHEAFLNIYWAKLNQEEFAWRSA